MEPLVVWECFDCAYQMTTDAEEPMEECDRCGSKAINVIGEVIDAALLDAFVNMGGATAWTGDGSSCAAQIVQNIMEERDSLREERDALLVELSQKPSEPARWEYMDFQFNSHPSIPETLEQLNRLGQEGWELCDTIDAGPQVRPLVVLLFKRRLCAQTNK